ncbi:RmlC-like cupin domain-containing protein [Flagelloscypha sp. PMI_526]|nr:RmlC-like cupin domain-containing protein [Flagelloscypha sp. PMI_526]
MPLLQQPVMTELIDQLKLSPHPEGGYFLETDKQLSSVPSTFAENQPRPLATSIYYLLTHSSPTGYVHMNKSVDPGSIEQNKQPTFTKHIIGPDGIWKMSRLLDADIEAASQGSDEDKQQLGCLITEVVTPGFVWEDHKYMTQEAFNAFITTWRERGCGELMNEVEKALRPYIKHRDAPN